MTIRMNRRRFLAVSAASPFILSLSACSSSDGQTATSRFADVPGEPLQVSGPIVIGSDETDVVISGKYFTGLGSGEYAIDIRGTGPGKNRNIVIRDCLFEDLSWGVRVNDSSGVSINSCRFENVGQGARFINCSNVQFDYNECLNVAHVEVGNGWWAANAVQFVHCTGAGNSASHNRCEQQPGQTNYLEDVISWYNSGGIASAPARCNGNQIRGGQASENGTGIMLGDMRDTDGYGELGAYIEASDNIVVNTQNAGIAVAGGNQMTVKDNRVLMETSHSQVLGSTTGVGLYVFNFSGTSSCSGHSFEGNRVQAFNGRGQENHFYENGSCSFSDTENVFGDDSLDASILPEDLFAQSGFEYFSNRQV